MQEAEWQAGGSGRGAKAGPRVQHEASPDMALYRLATIRACPPHVVHSFLLIRYREIPGMVWLLKYPE